MARFRWLEIARNGQIIERVAIDDKPLTWEPLQPSDDPANLLSQLEARGWIVEEKYGPDRRGMLRVFVIER